MYTTLNNDYSYNKITKTTYMIKIIFLIASIFLNFITLKE